MLHYCFWIQHDNCSLLKTSSGIQSCQSHSCNQCVYKSMLQWLSGMLNACVEGKSDIRHVPVDLAVYCNLHKDELDTVSQQRYFYRFPVKARERILLNCFCLSFDVRTLKVRLLWVQKMGKIHLRWLDGMTQFSILVGWVSRSGFHVAHVAVWANSHKGASVIDAGKNSGLLVREVSGTVRLSVFSLYLPVGVRGHCSLLLYPSKITNVIMSKSFQSCGRTNSCCPKEAEQVRQEGPRERAIPRFPPAVAPVKRGSATFKTKHLIGHRDHKDMHGECQLPFSRPQRYAWVKCKYICIFFQWFSLTQQSPAWQPGLDGLSVTVEDCWSSYGLLQNKPVFSTHILYELFLVLVFVSLFIVVTFAIIATSILKFKMIVFNQVLAFIVMP